jgi:hypothetical protein
MKTLDEILAIIGIEPNSEYDTNYTNVKKMFVEWANGIIGEDDEFIEKALDAFHGGENSGFVIGRNALRREQRACIEKEKHENT